MNNFFEILLSTIPVTSSVWTNLQNYWRLNETGGTNSFVYDSVGTATGTIRVGAMESNGKRDYCWKNTTRTSYGIEFGNINKFERNLPFSYNFWVYHTSINYWQCYLSTTYAGTGHAGYYLFINNSNNIYWELRSDSTHAIQGAVQSGSPLSINTWYMITFTYDGSSTAAGVKLYINGVNKSITSSNDTLTTGSLNSTEKFRLGGDYENAYSVTGRLDEVGCWNSVLSQDTITSLYNSGNGLFY